MQIPGWWISAVERLYQDNYHYIMFRGQRCDGFEMTRGMKQGCPLSAILFIYVFDLFLKALITELHLIDGIVCGVADDVGIVLDNLFSQVPVVIRVACSWAKASSMHLNLKKCVIVPLFAFLLVDLRDRIDFCIPGAKDFLIASYAKYLGVLIGPGAEDEAWTAALAKYFKAAMSLKSRHPSLMTLTRLYNMEVLPILSWQAQLRKPSKKAYEVESYVLRAITNYPFTAFHG